MLDPRRLLTFREVAHHRSFSRAAAALSLTQPAVSQQVRALEVQLGERLIERGRSGFALTPAGELLLGHADAPFARLRLAETQLGEAIEAARRLLGIGAFPSVLATLVPKAIVEVNRSVGPLESARSREQRTSSSPPSATAARRRRSSAIPSAGGSTPSCRRGLSIRSRSPSSTRCGRLREPNRHL